MQTKHTPGPWKAVRKTDRDGKIYFQVEHGDDGECVAEQVLDKADACAMAAVPELLELAEDFVAWDNRYPKSSINPYGGARELDELFARARAAIAKALGREGQPNG